MRVPSAPACSVRFPRLNAHHLAFALAALVGGLVPASRGARAEAPAAAPQLSAAAILDRVLQSEALGFRSGQVSMTLLIQDASGESRERRLLIRGMVEPDGRRALVRVTAPAEVAGQAYLFRENQRGEDDFYIFLPALDDAPRRISGNQKNGSFMGSHLTYADLETRDLRAATATRLPDERIGQFPVYVVDAVPGPGQGAEAARIRLWVRQSDFVPLRIRYFDDDGTPTRTLFIEQTANASGRTYVRRMTLRPAAGGATTVIVENPDFDARPTAAEMTPQALAH